MGLLEALDGLLEALDGLVVLEALAEQLGGRLAGPLHGGGDLLLRLALLILQRRRLLLQPRPLALHGDVPRAELRPVRRPHLLDGALEVEALADEPRGRVSHVVKAALQVGLRAPRLGEHGHLALQRLALELRGGARLEALRGLEALHLAVVLELAVHEAHRHVAHLVKALLEPPLDAPRLVQGAHLAQEVAPLALELLRAQVLLLELGAQLVGLRPRVPQEVPVLAGAVLLQLVVPRLAQRGPREPPPRASGVQNIGLRAGAEQRQGDPPRGSSTPPHDGARAVARAVGAHPGARCCVLPAAETDERYRPNGPLRGAGGAANVNVVRGDGVRKSQSNSPLDLAIAVRRSIAPQPPGPCRPCGTGPQERALEAWRIRPIRRRDG